MLVNTSLKTLPGVRKDPTGLTSTFSLDNFLRAWTRPKSPTLSGQLRARYATVAPVLDLLPRYLSHSSISRRLVRGWNLVYILFVIALFLPVALIPQFQLLLNLHLYTPSRATSCCSSRIPIGVIILVGYIRSIRGSWMRQSPSTAAVTSGSSSGSWCR